MSRWNRVFIGSGFGVILLALVIASVSPLNVPVPVPTVAPLSAKATVVELPPTRPRPKPRQPLAPSENVAQNVNVSEPQTETQIQANDHLEQILSEVEVAERLAFDQVARGDQHLVQALTAIYENELREIGALPIGVGDEVMAMMAIHLWAQAQMRLVLTPAQLFELEVTTLQNQHEAIQRMAALPDELD